MKFNLDSVRDFQVGVTAIYNKNNLTEEKLTLHNFSLDNNAMAMRSLSKKNKYCKFLFENNKKITPFLLRIYLEKNGNVSSPYNIYPGDLHVGENYFWNNFAGFHIGNKFISLYISHNYIKNYDFPNISANTAIYLTEYML